MSIVPFQNTISLIVLHLTKAYRNLFDLCPAGICQKQHCMLPVDVASNFREESIIPVQHSNVKKQAASTNRVLMTHPILRHDGSLAETFSSRNLAVASLFTTPLQTAMADKKHCKSIQSTICRCCQEQNYVNLKAESKSQ